VGPFDFRFVLLAVGDFLEGLASAFWRLLLEETIDGVHLRRISKLDAIDGCVDLTFSSSLRFSLRFLRRRAISARRIACSSAVRCFFFCASVQPSVHRLNAYVNFHTIRQSQ
jgi:hypothetical protein